MASSPSSLSLMPRCSLYFRGRDIFLLVQAPTHANAVAAIKATNFRHIAVQAISLSKACPTRFDSFRRSLGPTSITSYRQVKNTGLAGSPYERSCVTKAIEQEATKVD